MRKDTMTIVAALTVAAALTNSCSNDQLSESINAKKMGEMNTYTLSIPAFKPSVDITTRAIEQNGTALKTKWLTTEKIYAYINDDGTAIELTPSNLTNDDQKATLTGTLTKTGGFTTEDQIMLYYLKHKTAYGNYAGQVGTLADIAANFDFMKATVTVQAVAPSGDDNILATSTANFDRQQAITKFTVKKKGDNTDFDISPITISDGSTSLTVTPAPAAHEIWVAMPGSAEKKYKFEATSDSKAYGTSKTVELVNNRYYTATLIMGRDVEKVNVTGLPTAGGSQAFTGSAVNITGVTNNESKTMTPTTDYNVTYYQNTGTTESPTWKEIAAADVKAAGSYKAVITGAGEYDGTFESAFNITKKSSADVNTALENGTITNGTQISQGTNTPIIPTSVLGLTGTQFMSSTDTNTGITIGTLTPTGSWATINENGELVTTGGGIVPVTISIGETDDHEAGSVTKTIYVKQSGIGGEVPNPGSGSDGW